MRDDFRDLVAFMAVARDRNFTRVAAELGLSQSAISHKIRGLETKLGVRLLMRTARSVSPTEAGERLMRTVAPRFDVISNGWTLGFQHVFARRGLRLRSRLLT